MKPHFATIAVLAWIFFQLLFVSCSNPTDITDTDSARIVWGEHIEEVRIGDDSTTVVQKLGPPSYMIGGDFSGWTFYYTEDTDYHSMTIRISQDPALHPGVFSLEVWRPYDGTTEEGVGLEMRRKNALEYLPQPDSTQFRPGGDIFDSFFYEKNTFFTRYNEAEKMYMIGMGIALPYH
ncbi:hypothetical protein DYD21_04720 [Rhodohalobacter sp. SW132]|uniref:hypothetical protein n=1 Tax=Rhodohalobacter sp. SW132 TaxID=2293433 RepID=UPI000E23AE97|nr:hypothetical protein [Rhodohalobacter sp. SW132]REL39260.1 hypothetical protein DYD21_04720 [Rhodohalobacter sp. SW132]